MNPMEALRTLCERLEQSVGSLGLEMHQVVIIPSRHPGHPDMLQAVFMIAPQAIEVVAPDPEQAIIDAQVEEMARQMQEEALVERVRQAQEAAKNWLEGK